MTKTAKTQLLESIQDAAYSRENYITEIFNKDLSSSNRARSYRFEGNITLRDALRVTSFLSNIANGDKISENRYYTLHSEIPAFEQAITCALARKIERYLAA